MTKFTELEITETADKVRADMLFKCSGKITITGMNYETMRWGKVIHQTHAVRKPEFYANGMVAVRMFGSKFSVIAEVVSSDDTDATCTLFRLDTEIA